jgi:hypothetical protein
MAYVQEAIDKPYQIVCEGADDFGLLRRLIRDRAIPDFQVGCPRNKDGHCQGSGAFPERLQAIVNFSTVPNKGVIIMADCDDAPVDKFRFACNCLRGSGFASPPSPLTIAMGKDGRKAAVIMIPGANQHGGMETLLLACCAGVAMHAPCIDAFCACIPAAPRKIDQDKLRLRAFIAATHPEDPGLALTSWLSSKNRPFPMSHTALDSIVAFLVQFAAA